MRCPHGLLVHYWKKIMCISNPSLLIFSFQVLCYCISEEPLSHWGVSISVLMCFCSSHLLQLRDDEIVHLGLAEIVEHFSAVQEILSIS